MIISLKNTVLFCGCMTLSSGFFAQEAFVANGNEAQGTGGTVSSSIGQVFDQSFSQTTGTVSQGVQQAYEIFTANITELAKPFNIQVYPNPTDGQIQLSLEAVSFDKLIYRIMDLNGKQLAVESISTTSSLLSFDLYPAGVYLLDILSNNQSIQTFKIIKK